MQFLNVSIEYQQELKPNLLNNEYRNGAWENTLQENLQLIQSCRTRSELTLLLRSFECSTLAQIFRHHHLIPYPYSGGGINDSLTIRDFVEYEFQKREGIDIRNLQPDLLIKALPAYASSPIEKIAHDDLNEGIQQEKLRVIEFALALRDNADYQNTIGAVFVPNEHHDNSDANFLGTFSFSYFNDKGERTSAAFNLPKKYTRSVVIPEKIINENHYAFFGESFIEFCNSQNSTVAAYYPYLDTIQFRTEWTIHYRQSGSAVNEFSFEYSLRSVLNDILKSAGYLDDNGNFIHDSYGAFRIHAWNFFMQNRQNDELKDFIMPDIVFSGYEDRDNPITWVKDSPVRNDALRAYIRLLYTEDNAKIIKKYCPHDEGILDSFILNLREMHYSCSDINENEALSYNEAVNALCETALKYDVNSNLNHIFLSYHSALDDDFAQVLEKCTNKTLHEIAFNNTAPLYVCSGSGRGNYVPTRQTEIHSPAENLGTIAAGILAGRISHEAIMKHHDNHKRVALWVMFLERRKENSPY